MGDGGCRAAELAFDVPALLWFGWCATLVVGLLKLGYYRWTPSKAAAGVPH